LKAPIYDFVRNYADKNPVRFHMPGHKGKSFFDNERTDGFSEIYRYDITEIDGADYLADAHGIIAESEANATELFGCDTFYSTEGSSLCIRAMIYLLCKRKENTGNSPFVLAGRNAHASFLKACAAMDVHVDWIMPLKSESFESCTVTGKYIEEYITGKKGRNEILPDALYITSPDYLGNGADISELAETCHRYGILLLVDNAHGAYLKFLDRSLFPIDLGADICCSSAHKTLPVLTGGAYLHINSDTVPFFSENAREALAFFASSSPSYLTLQSLDLCNIFLKDKAVNEKLYQKMGQKLQELKDGLTDSGCKLVGDEPLKLTLKCGGKAGEIAERLIGDSIIPEYHDRDSIVLMFSPLNTAAELEKTEISLKKILSEYSETFKEAESIPTYERIPKPVQALSFKKAVLSPSEYVSVEQSIGRIMAQPVLSCPPCVPVYMYGEVIGENIIKYCKNKKIKVVKT